MQSGNIVVDTHVGSASSLIACAKPDYPYIGFENDRANYDNAVERMKNEADIPLFSAPK